MERVVSATEARIHFGELMRQVIESEEPVIVERGGKSHIVVMSVTEYERLLKGQQPPEDWKTLVGQARAQIRSELGGRRLPPVEEVLELIRGERDAQLLAVH